jgi:hypothetical protein
MELTNKPRGRVQTPTTGAVRREGEIDALDPSNEVHLSRRLAVEFGKVDRWVANSAVIARKEGNPSLQSVAATRPLPSLSFKISVGTR